MRRHFAAGSLSPITSGRRKNLTVAAWSLLFLLTIVALATQAAHAQTYTVIYNFTGGPDGAMPMAGLTADASGRFYGMANLGGSFGGNCGAVGCGTVYRISNTGLGWRLTSLYTFKGGNDGAYPQTANAVIGNDGTLYSSTYSGGGTCNGNDQGCGIVFKLQPPASVCTTAVCPWTETILTSFNGEDGAGPVGTMVIDPSGNLNGVTSAGGLTGGGTVYQLDRSNGWMENVLFNPYGYPGSGVVLSSAGDLFGSTFSGLDNPGTIYQLIPSGSGWSGNIIYGFLNGSDGSFPKAGVIFDAEGNLYGATTAGGAGHGGTAFELIPENGGWAFHLLYSFNSPNNGQVVMGPVGSLIMDAAGNLYGTTIGDGANGHGAVFKLSPSNGTWLYTSLHDFTGGTDGAYPYSNLAFDSNGDLYGTASAGGAFGAGVVFEVTGVGSGSSR